MKLKRRQQALAAGFLLFLFCNISVRANVYATDIRLNASQNAGVIVPGGKVTITYILNDDADAGLTARIFSGTNVIKTIPVPGGSIGSRVGLNSLVWGGTNESGAQVSPGIYTVSITAASRGYDDWTAITDDDTNFYAPGPRGIDVNRNANSPYYGRVFVGCTVAPAASPWIGVLADAEGFGILKCNSDGSPADEGGFSTGGLTWGDGTGVNSYYSPWKIAVAANDKVYINDFSGYGLVYAFDETVSTNFQEALTSDNYPYSAPYLSGLCATGSATNGAIWMADLNPGQSAGIVQWQLLADGTVSTNDFGTVICPATNMSPLSMAPYDLAIDTNGIVYTIQQVSTNLGIVPIMSFAAYAGMPETNALWTAGTGDTNLIYDYGIAVDQSAKYVAIASRGGGDPEQGASGGLYLYHASNGSFFTNLDQTGGDQYTDVAWDNVGNLYALDTFANVWRAYSPPGSNQATTVSAPFIQAYNALTIPSLGNASLAGAGPSLSATGLNLTLQGQSNVTYYIQQSPDLLNWTDVATNFSTSTSRSIPISFADSQDFYRAVTGH
jgi:hypothetical protein